MTIPYISLMHSTHTPLCTVLPCLSHWIPVRWTHRKPSQRGGFLTAVELQCTPREFVRLTFSRVLAMSLPGKQMSRSRSNYFFQSVFILRTLPSHKRLRGSMKAIKMLKVCWEANGRTGVGLGLVTLSLTCWFCLFPPQFGPHGRARLDN